MDIPRSIICIIPARQGSKRLPEKNIRIIGGKPLIAHSIEHAKASRYINSVIVSTDGEQIAAVSKKYGAEVILRPADLSHDTATSESALLHVLGELEKQKQAVPALVVFLQCTSPIREEGDIDRAIESFMAQSADSLLSACKNERYLWRPLDTGMASLNYDYRHRKRDQDHPTEYQENGSIYIFKPEILLQQNNRLGGKIAVFEMDYWSSFQIDSEPDFELCDWILSEKNKKQQLARLPVHPQLVISDFDGVMTDNKVVLSETGTESVVCNRSDGLGLQLFKTLKIPFVVLSTEANGVVKKRCEKLDIPCQHNIGNKAKALDELMKRYDVLPDNIIYIGNDVNDLECMRQVGCSIAVADAHPAILSIADIVLHKQGGQGAVREFCDLMLSKFGKSKKE